MVGDIGKHLNMEQINGNVSIDKQHFIAPKFVDYFYVVLLFNKEKNYPSNNKKTLQKLPNTGINKNLVTQENNGDMN